MTQHRRCLGWARKSMYTVLLKHLKQVQSLSDLSGNNLDIAKDVARKLIALMYDPKEKFKDAHGNLNKLRVRQTTSKETTLARLPLCETSFSQQTLRLMFQTHVWMNSHVAKCVIRLPLYFG